MRPLVAAVALSALVVPAAVAGGATKAQSGLLGLVVRGPITPVCREGEVCIAPVARLHVTVTGAGSSRTTVTDRNGRFRLALAPGSYRVRLATRLRYRPHDVDVPAGRVVRVTFSLDTGIR